MSWKSLLKTALAFVAIVWLSEIRRGFSRKSRPGRRRRRSTLRGHDATSAAGRRRHRAGRFVRPKTGTNLDEPVI